MQSDSAKADSNVDDASAGVPADETNRKQSQSETLAATASSLPGLAAPSSASGSSTDIISSGLSGSGQTISVGQSFGRYHVQKVLGSGSMGSVFLAHDSQLDRPVALKLPRIERDVNGELSERLQREARAAAMLTHPNICPIYDISAISGIWFIAMGYVAGRPLSEYIASKRQPEKDVAKVIRKVALALHEAHGHGILHRDLKPTNIMIDKRGEPIVMDFGVACWFEDQRQTRLTQDGAIVGTPAYMSPEQIQGRAKIGPACDIYSLGVVLYQLLTGRCPFEGTVLNVISQVLHQDPPSVTRYRPDCSPELVAICERALQKDPANRFPSMREFAKALTAFLNKLNKAAVAQEATQVMQPARKSQSVTPLEDTQWDSEVEEVELPKPARPRRSSPSAAAPLPKRISRKLPKPKRSKNNWLLPVLAGVGAAALLIGAAVVGAVKFRNPVTPAAATVDAEPDQVTPATPQKVATSAKPVVASPAPISSTSAARNAVSGANAKLAASPGLPQQTATPVQPAVSSGMVPQPGHTQQTPLQPVPKIGLNPVATASSSATKPAPTSAQGRVPGPGQMAASGGRSAGPRPDFPARGGVTVAQGQPSPPGQQFGDRPGQPPPPQGMPFDGGPPRGMKIEDYFKKRDTNKDGKLDPTELPLHIILRADTNKDGELSLHELVVAFRRRGQKLFGPPTQSELRRMRQYGGRPPDGGPPNGGSPAGGQPPWGPPGAPMGPGGQGPGGQGRGGPPGAGGPPGPGGPPGQGVFGEPPNGQRTGGGL